MANPEHVLILRGGVARWNRWRKMNPHIRPALQKANLRGADLKNINLSFANLKLAKLYGATLTNADLRHCDFEGADASRIEATGANFSNSNLRQIRLEGSMLNWAVFTSAAFRKSRLVDANFRRAIFSGTKISRCSIDRADLTAAVLYETSFIDLDLSQVIGLDQCEHYGPSAIDNRTLARSGRLPTGFFRGCGLEDWEIEMARLYHADLHIHDVAELVNKVVAMRNRRPVQFYSCFISYSTKDQAFADRLYADLQAKGVRCWFAPQKMRGGEKLYKQIDEAIRVSDRLLLILSEHSMKSNWVETEISKARKRELQEGRQMLFPVLLADFETLRNWECFDADTGKDSAREIREYFIPNFSNWNDDGSYQTAFRRLLTDLKAAEARPTE